MGDKEKKFYKNKTVVHSVSLRNEQLFWIQEKYPNFSLSKWVQNTLTEKGIQLFIKTNLNGNGKRQKK